jgi:hypothetical protein
VAKTDIVGFPSRTSAAVAATVEHPVGHPGRPDADGIVL